MMKNRQPLTVFEKERIYKAKQEGKTIAEIAVMIDCSTHCIRKWWRCGRDYGLSGLQKRRRGRSKKGKLSQFRDFLHFSRFVRSRARGGVIESS
jgi:transposase